jgi:predicted NACHT family NTPase
VVLREYGGMKKTDGLSLLQFVEKQARSRYQVTPPPGAFEYLFLNGRALVIFDGLDELLDTHYRQEISADVESFCNLYPAVPAIVTSREVGYDQAPLDGGTFSLYSIAPFNNEQVAAYARKWFDRDDELLPDLRAKKAAAFLKDSELTPDLRSNPLMLALMCNLYRVEGYIPRNRPDVYEKCSVMLFERWDKGRGILLQLAFEAHIRPAMEHLAYWIYSNDAYQAGVTGTLLAEQTSTYLSKWVFEDGREASLAADGFVAFCTGRAWVFTDTGTTPEGEKLFQFTHRTFLEYFCAMYLCSLHATPAQLAAALQDRIAKREWDVVAQLAFQIQSRRTQGAADALLGHLLESASAEVPVASWYFLTFAARCLQIVVPSPRIRRSVAIACVEAILDGRTPQDSAATPRGGPIEILDIIGQRQRREQLKRERRLRGGLGSRSARNRQRPMPSCARVCAVFLDDSPQSKGRAWASRRKFYSVIEGPHSVVC